MGFRAAALLLALLPTGLAAQGRDLRAFYQARCLVCHGPDGTGRAANGARLGGRNLTDRRWLAKAEEADLIAAILKGRGAMPGFGRQLTEVEARRLLAEVLRPLATRRRSEGTKPEREPPKASPAEEQPGR